MAIKRALAVAEVFSPMEPTGLVLEDGRRSYGMTITPWEGGKSLVWDGTCLCTIAPKNIAKSTAEAGGAANEANRRKNAKYQPVLPNFCFISLGYGIFGSWANMLLN